MLTCYRGKTSVFFSRAKIRFFCRNTYPYFRICYFCGSKNGLMRKIQMVDLKSQYDKIKDNVNAAIQEVLDTTTYINGPLVHEFQKNLENYLGVKHVIPCANGTDAL